MLDNLDLNLVQDPAVVITEPSEDEKCVMCESSNLEIIYENNGFNPPFGPSMIEPVGVACLDCGHKEYD